MTVYERSKGAIMLYKIVRNYFDRENAPRPCAVKTGLTLQEAQAHCQDPETSSRTCKKAANVARTRKYGPWFDGYTEDT
jgi:hypothetical protein